jgi:hypothetical protein
LTGFAIFGAACGSPGPVSPKREVLVNNEKRGRSMRVDPARAVSHAPADQASEGFG